MAALCPFGDGQHKRKVWQDAKTGRSGQMCMRCCKTWTWIGGELVPTYNDDTGAYQLIGKPAG